MGKYSQYVSKQKPLKRKFFIPFMSLVCLFSELILLIVMMAVMRSLNVNSETLGARPMMLDPLYIIGIGLGYCIVYSLLEKICRGRREMKWWDFLIPGYIIPVIFWGITSIITTANWWSKRDNDDAIVLKWMTLVMLIYMSCALLFRLIGHIIAVIFDKFALPESSRKKNETAKENKKKKK